MIFYFVQFVFKNLERSIKSKFSEKSLNTLKIVSQVLDYLLPIALGMLIYYSWQKKGISSIVFFGVFMIMKIIDIIRNKKKRQNEAIPNKSDIIE
jgi:uncharacterized membrane protein HdeD (DUF308 family)